MCQYTYSKYQICFAWICQVNSCNSRVVSDWSPGKVSGAGSVTSHDVDLKFTFFLLYFFSYETQTCLYCRYCLS